MQAAIQNGDRLRQIAILISSVDAATGRQLLLHFPTATAKKVRALVNNLGPVSQQEREQVLADFQSSVGNNPAPAGNNTTEQPPAASRNPTAPTQTNSPLSSPDVAVEETDRPKWAALAPEALLEFVRGERPTIIAVVISQLQPEVAVEILQQLPGSVNQEVLKLVSGLGDIDDAAIEQIDAYLNERFTEYHKTSLGREANRRRMDALISAAPPALRDHWRSLLGQDDSTTLNDRASEMTVSTAEPRSPAEALADTVEDHFETTEQSANILPFPQDSTRDEATRLPRAESPEPSAETSRVTNGSAETTAVLSPRDRSLLQIEFEQLLNLEPHNLATVLSTPPASTVLLALAGSTPEFMSRFYDLLLPRDAEALRVQMTAISSLKLSDIDDAQREIVELMSTLRAGPSMRQAA